jgi:hypothetical protein
MITPLVSFSSTPTSREADIVVNYGGWDATQVEVHPQTEAGKALFAQIFGMAAWVMLKKSFTEEFVAHVASQGLYAKVVC